MVLTNAIGEKSVHFGCLKLRSVKKRERDEVYEQAKAEAVAGTEVVPSTLLYASEDASGT